jgi:Na+/H+ antiporter NhaD/arsenite permease-like protein
MIFLLLAVFFIGYLLITLENAIHINKSAIALITSVLCWTILVMNPSSKDAALSAIGHHLTGVAEIVFFLLAAMTIVELIDAHDGFQNITEKIKTTNKSKFIWTIALVTFFLSAVLDNLTSTIVMMSIINKLVKEKRVKWHLLGLVIISSNAGGAWSPIGDVTTTMLWIGHQMTPLNIIKETFLASLTCMVIPTIIINYRIKGSILLVEEVPINQNVISTSFERNVVFFIGVSCLLFVPFFKVITELPPYMGMLCSLGIMWVLTEFMHHNKVSDEKGNLSVSHALRKIDTPSILFFVGILMSIAALEQAGLLKSLAAYFDHQFSDIKIIAIVIGLVSSVVDNVPMVAALQSMYSLDMYPTDHYFWEFLAYTAGTGGSVLIIGSAAGVAVMGIEKIDFFWYLKNISWVALIGFLTGALVFILENV